MQKNEDRRATMRATEGRDDFLAARAAAWGRALKAVIALVALVAVIASVPALSRADFPLASLLIYTLGMGFIAMPLCLYYELLLKRSTHGT